MELDDRDLRGGEKNWSWIKRGIPLRVEIGPRDIADNAVFVARRDKAHRDRNSMDKDRFVAEIGDILDDIQKNLFARALQFRKDHTTIINDPDEFSAYFTPRDREKREIHGGFALSGWCGADECEAGIKERLGVTIRCLPFEDQLEIDSQQDSCIYCRKPSETVAVFAKAY